MGSGLVASGVATCFEIYHLEVGSGLVASGVGI